jgi:hypothetical protein
VSTDVDAGISAGYDNKQHIPFDTYVAFVVSVGVGPVALIPGFGIGGDSYGGAAATEYRMRAALYYYPKCDLLLKLGPVGAQLGAANMRRGALDGSRNVDASRETRFDGSLSYDRYSLGAHMIQYNHAFQGAGSFGVRF